MKYLIAILLMTVSAQAENILKISGGIEYKIDGKYDDRLANVDVAYLKNYNKAFTYGISGGVFRMNDYWIKNDAGVDLYKASGFSTLYVCGRGGVSIKPASFMYLDFMTGPCWFDKAHILISGHIQFNTEVSYGLRDPNTGSTVGITVRHFSNAGMEQPNFGANLYMFTMGIALD